MGAMDERCGMWWAGVRLTGCTVKQASQSMGAMDRWQKGEHSRTEGKSKRLLHHAHKHEHSQFHGGLEVSSMGAMDEVVGWGKTHIL